MWTFLKICTSKDFHVGSIELQLAWRLLQKDESLSEDDASDDDMDSNGEPTTSMDDEERDGDDMDENDEHCGCSGDSKKKKALPADAKAALASGALVLP
ncbi:hypothetical protein KC19_VG309500 [Ceratodon purpureus]|uniref:Uncharacterized protein n=1 Tax=Ceratodon purpureus TaxID=3225 RepID=A0A8T0HW35_CERPU|nr:hypothetical protein KC19_VG309500 [Ceratodon purpureus]